MVITRCGICYEELDSKNKDKRCPQKCNGHFHPKCLTTWMQRSMSCPHCRATIGGQHCHRRLTFSLPLMIIMDREFDREIDRENVALPLPPTPSACRECGCTRILNRNPDQVCTGCGLIVYSHYSRS